MWLSHNVILIYVFWSELLIVVIVVMLLELVMKVDVDSILLHILFLFFILLALFVGDITIEKLDDLVLSLLEFLLS